MFTDPEKAKDALTEESTRGGYFHLAVVEKLVRGGDRPKLKVVGWWERAGHAWQQIERPDAFAIWVNFAIG